MFSDLPCLQCEKIVVEFQSVDEVQRLLDAPNTFDSSRGTFVWKEFDLMKYTLIPRAIENTKAWVDLYMCIDEDDLDDMDLYEYAESFLKIGVLPQWTAFSVTHLVPPFQATPEMVACWRLEELRAKEAH